MRYRRPPAPYCRVSKADDKNAFGKAHVPYGADGAGLYSAATRGCFDVVQVGDWGVERDACCGCAWPLVRAPFSSNHPTPTLMAPQAAAPMATEALQAALEATSPGSCVRIADFGTADAGTSMPLMNHLVDLVAK